MSARETTEEAVSRIARDLLDGKIARCEAIRQAMVWAYRDAAEQVRKDYKSCAYGHLRKNLAEGVERRAEEIARG